MKLFQLSLFVSILMFAFPLKAQDLNSGIPPMEIARNYVLDNLSKWNLTREDVMDMSISDMYTDPSTGITRVYFQQQFKGIPVYNALLNVNITKEGEVFFTGNRFVDHLAEKVNTRSPLLTAHDAVMNLCAHLNLAYENFQLQRHVDDSLFIFEKNSIVREDIPASLSYQPYGDKVMLSWDVLLAPASNHDKWSTRVDAVTGEILHKANWTIYCNTDRHSFERDQDCSFEHIPSESIDDTRGPGTSYRVWAPPIESPNHGNRTLSVDPADSIASPYGWHDTDGQEGAEFTITKGNNVHAYQGREDLGYSSGDEPDGGSELYFDFPYEPLWEPEQYMEASTVNLFYWINFMHDFSYRFGFDETAGNFQQNNYGRGGIGNDFLWAVAQSGADAGYSNNAFYHHNNEGLRSSIHMFVFKTRKRFLRVNSPSSLQGNYFTSLPRDGWGPGAYTDSIPLTGEVVMLYDGIEDPSVSDGCEEILNAEELNGKIAFIDRGGCQFGFKALQAQNAGAIGVIVANFDDMEYTMNPGDEGALVNIPIVLIRDGDAQVIRQHIGNGLEVSLVDPGVEYPMDLDSDLNNGTIAHEFGHGISLRIAGGPDRMCLEHAEQMGEGWSDFFALAVTARPGDTGELERGFGAYLYKEPLTGKGFRRYPYSTDMNVMPLTFGDVSIGQEEHDLGEVWASMLWDMYWALVDRYGWKEDLYDPTSGNYKAVKLVVEGLKNVVCNPGFVDARNAILAADETLYGGENICLLWEVFARRGLGYSADQGSPFNAGDQKEAFDVLPICSDQIMIEKSVTPLINAGDDILVNIKVGNFKYDTATNIVLTDEIPNGTSFKSNSSSIPADVQGELISFQVGDIPFGGEVIVTYKLQSDPGQYSNLYFLDEVTEETKLNWLTYSIQFDGESRWTLSDSLAAHSGDFYWFSKEVAERTQQALELNPDVYTFHVDGDFPVLRFYHRYETSASWNGGVIDIREVGTAAWEQVGDKMIRNGYPGYIDYHTFAYPKLRAFSGAGGDGYIDTYVDLSKWKGKNIQIRFRFGTWPNSNIGEGWRIDDIAFLDMISYNGEACVISEQGDIECTTAPEAGTIVDVKEDVVSVPDNPTEISFHVYPNPASDKVTIALNGKLQHNAIVSLATIDGKLIMSKTVQNNLVELNTEDISPGIYFIQISSQHGKYVEKLLIL